MIDESDMTMEMIDANKAKAIIALLTGICKGPREAYSVLCLTIWMLNSDTFGMQVDIEQLALEVSESLRSIQPRQMQ